LHVPQGTGNPLSSPQFRILITARLISLTGSAVAPIALSFGVLRLPGGTAGDLGLVLAAALIPQVLFILIGGVASDRMSRRLLMIGSNLLSGISQLCAAALFLIHHANVWNICALAFAAGLSSAFFGPAMQGLLPQTVSSEQMQSANALFRLMRNLTKILAPALGGALIVWIGPGPAIAWDSLTYFVAAAILWRINVGSVRSPGRRVVVDFVEGWHDFWGRRWLWIVVIEFGVVNMLWAASYDVLGPTSLLHAGGAGVWGLNASAMAVGLAVGSVVSLRWRPDRILAAACLGSATMVLPIAALALRVPAPLLLASSFLAGIGLDIFNVCWATALQQNVPGELMGRISSFDMLGGLAFVPVGQLLAGPVAGRFGIVATQGWSALVIGVLTLSVVAVPAIWNLRRAQPVRPTSEPADLAVAR
jgi:MFS family permease